MLFVFVCVDDLIFYHIDILVTQLMQPTLMQYL